MNKCEFGTPGLILMGIGALGLLWLIGKLLGASFFFLCGLVVVFLLALIAYLVVRLYDEPLLEKINRCLGITEPKKEEEN